MLSGTTVAVSTGTDFVVEGAVDLGEMLVLGVSCSETRFYAPYLARCQRSKLDNLP